MNYHFRNLCYEKIYEIDDERYDTLTVYDYKTYDKCEVCCSETVCYFVTISKEGAGAGYNLCKDICFPIIISEFQKRNKTIFNPNSNGDQDECRLFVRLYCELSEKYYELKGRYFDLDNKLRLKAKKRKPLPTGIRHEVFKRDEYKCQECGVYKPDEGLEASHIIAVAKGGTDELDNLKTLCKTCNRQQRDLIW